MTIFKRLVFLSYIGLLLTSCNQSSTVREGYIYVQNAERELEPEKWKLLWEDQFDQKELDTNYWSVIPPNSADWGKHMSDNPDCIDLRDGKIYLNGIVNPDTIQDKRKVLTGGIWTKGKFAYQYGKIELYAKLESAQGSWPAMWMLAEEKIYGSYPKNGEIDLMEHLNFDDIAYQTTHSDYTLNMNGKNKPTHGGTGKIDKDGYNKFGMEWYPDRLVFKINDEETFSYPRREDLPKEQWPYDQPFFLLIDQQLGGSWVGEINQEDLPVSMIVDWVRVYQ